VPSDRESIHHVDVLQADTARAAGTLPTQNVGRNKELPGSH
jgi:hypothetical protein